jgi:hypothetical protein
MNGDLDSSLNLTTKLAILSSLLTVDFYAKADSLYNVSLDTAPLIGNSSSPFALDFQLTGGDTNSGIVNTAMLSVFTFGGGRTNNRSPFPRAAICREI